MNKHKITPQTMPTNAQPALAPELRDALVDIYSYLLARRAARQRNGAQSRQ